MTPQNTQALAHEFAHAISFIRMSFSHETASVTFAGPHAASGAELLGEWLAGASPHMRRHLQQTLLHDEHAGTQALAAAFMASVDGRTGNTLHDIPKGRSFVWAPYRARSADRNLGDPRKDALATLLHESGHGILETLPRQVWNSVKKHVSRNKAGASAEIVHRNEVAADLFAVPVGIRFTLLGRADFAELSLDRAERAVLQGDIAHASSRAIDQMLGEYTDADLTSFSARQIKSAVRTHARAFRVRENHSRLAASFGELAGPNVIPALARFCEKAPLRSDRFYLAARVLSSALSTGRLARRPIDISTPSCESARDMVASRAKKAGMSKMLDPYAKQR